jgi:uncharacterized Zn-binding protein involved in type VI secretion
MSHVICLGDLTTGGGQVVRCQLASTHRIKGRPAAVMGDLATCRKHKGESYRGSCWCWRGTSLPAGAMRLRALPSKLT